MFEYHCETINYPYPFQQGKFLDSRNLIIPPLSHKKSVRFHCWPFQKAFTVRERTLAPFPVRQATKSANNIQPHIAAPFSTPSLAVTADENLPAPRAVEIPPASGKEISQ
jgi:hypothetical protein